MHPEKEKQLDQAANKEEASRHDGLPKEGGFAFEMEDTEARIKADELVRTGKAYEEIKKDKNGDTISIITRLNDTDEIIYAQNFQNHPLDRSKEITDEFMKKSD
jgi:hypothetical protein